VSFVGDTVDHLTTADNWWGPSGLITRIGEHLWYSALALGVAVAIGLPLGLAIGHRIGRTGRGGALGWVAVNSTFASRAIPSLGVLYLLALRDVFALWPVIVTLAVLAVPPIVANTVAGLTSVDPDARDAAMGMGMTGWQVLGGVEVPLALALIITGIRSASAQVIATATIAATAALGGLGRPIFDGFNTLDYGQTGAGAFLVVVLVLVSEGIFGLIRSRVGHHLREQRRVVPRSTSAAAPVA
jgi:osmoprotectant transport system permease protein